MYFLYLIYIGGKTKESIIENHDIVLGIGKNIEDTFDQIKLTWHKKLKGLHIDSYKKIRFIDGYEIIPQKKTMGSNKLKANNKLKLWFVYIGGYLGKEIEESHQIIFLVAKTKEEAKENAKAKARQTIRMVHIDNILKLDIIKVKDNTKPNEYNEWLIHLRKDELERNDNILADWQGYKRLGY